MNMFLVDEGKLQIKPGSSEEAAKLSAVRLCDMNLRNVKALGSLKQLTSVNLAFNSLESLSALHGLSCLTMVDCSHNKIASLEGLADSIQSLTQLRCSDNVISGLHRLNQCSQLTELWINKNSLSRVEELLHLRGLASLRKLVLYPNPFCKNQSSASYRATVLRIIPQLDSLDAKPFTDAERMDASNMEDPCAKSARGKEPGKNAAANNLSRRGSLPEATLAQRPKPNRRYSATEALPALTQAYAPLIPAKDVLNAGKKLLDSASSRPASSGTVTFGLSNSQSPSAALNNHEVMLNDREGVFLGSAHKATAGRPGSGASNAIVGVDKFNSSGKASGFVRESREPKKLGNVASSPGLGVVIDTGSFKGNIADALAGLNDPMFQKKTSPSQARARITPPFAQRNSPILPAPRDEPKSELEL